MVFEFLSTRRFKKGDPGFTVVEFIITAFIFSVLVIAVGTIFIQVLNIQRRGFNAQEVQENALFILESMAKEIRVSDIPTGSDYDCVLSFANSLTVTHPVNGSVTYSLAGGGVIQRTAGSSTLDISSNAVRISRLNFCIKGRGIDNQQARVGIIMRIESAGSDVKNAITFDVQTTVTSRDITTELQN